MWRYFPVVSKTDNKKVVKETRQKADARNYENKRSRRRGGRGGSCVHEKNDDGVEDDDESGIRL